MRPGWPGLMLLLLEHDGGDVADLGVSALAVVEADELGEACGEFVECGEGMPVVELVFEDRPERLGGGVVAARSGGAMDRVMPYRSQVAMTSRSLNSPPRSVCKMTSARHAGG